MIGLEACHVSILTIIFHAEREALMADMKSDEGDFKMGIYARTVLHRERWIFAHNFTHNLNVILIPGTHMKSQRSLWKLRVILKNFRFSVQITFFLH